MEATGSGRPFERHGNGGNVGGFYQGGAMGYVRALWGDIGCEDDDTARLEVDRGLD